MFDTIKPSHALNIGIFVLLVKSGDRSLRLSALKGDRRLSEVLIETDAIPG